MFGSVILDAYKKDDTNEIADALDEICNPNDSYGWASAGIYCFWDYYTHEILYIGLASDLCERFKQHNGLLPIDDACCKRKKIEEYFKDRELLGYSIFVQSPLSQPLVHRNKRRYEKFAKQVNSPIEDMLSKQGQDDIKRVEGILIEAYRQKYGDFPTWNQVGGNISGQHKVMPNNINIVLSFAHTEKSPINPIVSRSTLRELALNSEYELYECNLFHPVRVYMLIFGMDYLDALEFVKKTDSFGYYEKMLASGYNDKRLII